LNTYLERYVLSGGIMMIFLIPCSILALWFILQGFINLRRARIAPHGLVARLRPGAAFPDHATLRSSVTESESCLGRILARLLDMVPAPMPYEWDDVAAELIDDEVSRLYHKNNQLAVIYTVSPLLGLLGTILGMMNTFFLFSRSEEQSIAQLSQGINEALVTTMWGLAIAIPSFVVLYIFKQKLFFYEMTLLPGEVKKVMRVLANSGAANSTGRPSEGDEEIQT